MRIAFLNPAAGLGGAERILLHLMWSLRAADAGMELHLLAPADGPLSQRAAAIGVVPHIVPMPAALVRTGESHLRDGRGGSWSAFARQSIAAVPAVGRYVRALGSALARIRPDVVHSNGIKTHLAAAAIPPRGILVWHAHDFFSARPLTARLLCLAARRAGGILAISEAVAADARGLLRGLPVAPVPNAIDLTEFTPGGGRADLDRLAGLPPAGPVVRVGLVATYATWKGHDVFLAAAGRLISRRPDLRFYVVGGPIYQTQAQRSVEELRQLADCAGLDGRVGFVPFLPEPADAYRALDVVVHASTLPEPFGLTIAEAMACGRAVIVSNAGGAAELFTDGHDAVGVPPEDPAALATAIERLATDAELRRRLGEQARATAVRRFDRARLGPQVLQAYDMFLSRVARGRRARTAEIPPSP